MLYVYSGRAGPESPDRNPADLVPFQRATSEMTVPAQLSRQQVMAREVLEHAGTTSIPFTPT